MTIPQQFHPNPPGLLMRIACYIGGKETLTRYPQWVRGGGYKAPSLRWMPPLPPPLKNCMPGTRIACLWARLHLFRPLLMLEL